MIIAVGTDHAGFSLKKVVINAVESEGHKVVDVGSYDLSKVDFPDYAEKVGDLIQRGEAQRGIALCGSGIGVCIALNKMSGVYASVCHDTYSAHQGVEHDGMNVLCLGGRVIGEELAKDIVSSFLSAEQMNETKFFNRINKIKAIETKHLE